MQNFGRLEDRKSRFVNNPAIAVANEAGSLKKRLDFRIVHGSAFFPRDVLLDQRPVESDPEAARVGYQDGFDRED